MPFDMWRVLLAGAAPHEKLLFGVLLTEQTLNHAGVGRICVPLWARDAGLSDEEAETALAGLGKSGHVVVDQDTYEVFVVALMTTIDRVTEQPFVLKGALKEALLTVSPRIRLALAAQLRRMPPRQPDGVSKSGKPIIYPDPHAAADLLDPPPEPRPSRNPSERVSEGYIAAPETPPKGNGEEEGEGEGVSPVSSNSSSVGARKRGTRIPDDFATAGLTPDMIAWVRREHPHVDGRAQTEAMVDHFRAAPGQKGVKLDWEATWRNWMRRAAEQTPRGAQPRHLAPVAKLPSDPAKAFADIRERGDARGAARLLGVPYIPKPQPPSDDTPSRVWDRTEALRFIDQHRAALLAALAEGQDVG